jgi:CHAT domain-containing protein/tetratricopeptide (TPR) repeat protein
LLATEQSLDSAVLIAQDALQAAEEFNYSQNVVLTILDSLGQWKARQRDFAAAEQYCRRHLLLTQQVYGEGSAEAGTSLFLLGWMVYEQGRIETADSIYQACFVLREKALGKQHPQIGNVLDQLGMCAYEQGRFADAEQYAEQALSIYEHAAAISKSDLIIALNNLARAYDAQCRYPQAEQTYKRALSISKAAFGPEHTYTASELANLGILYWRQQRFTDAETNCRQAIEIYEKMPGSNDPILAYLSRALGAICESQNRPQEAEWYHLRALRIDSTIFGMNHPNVAMDMNNLGELSLHAGNFRTAENWIHQAIRQTEQSLGTDHPDLASYCSSLSCVHRAQDRWRDAQNAERHAYEIRRRNFRDGFEVLSESNALLYSRLMRDEAGRFVTLLLGRDNGSLADQREIAEVVLSTKGQITDGMFVRHRTYSDERDPVLRSLADSLYRARTLLAEYIIQGPSFDRPEAYRANLAKTTALKDHLETELARRSAAFRRDHELWDVRVTDVARALPPHSLLVEYYRYEHETEIEKTETRYLAFAITPENEVFLYSLGNADSIDHIVDRYQTHFQSPETATLPAYRAINDALYPLIWKPLESIVGTAETIFIAPDGNLNAVSIAGLMDSSQTYLIEKYAIHYIMSGRDLLRLTNVEEHPVGRGLLAFGDPDFDHAAFRSKPEAKKPSDESSIISLLKYRGNPPSFEGMQDIHATRLPGTRKELELAAELWASQNRGPVRMVVGRDAGEERLKQECAGWQILHIATHGFYNVSKDGATDPTAGSPLLRSGLLLAGANLIGKKGRRSGEDGFLTAEEVAQLNLDGTELVVLSACATGLGEVMNGEGAYGLRRSFQMAGARTVICTLWPISDRATAELIGNIYAVPGRPIPDATRSMALRHISEMRRSGKQNHPKDWAAFIAVGDWRSR